MLVAENPDDPARPKTYAPLQYRFPDGESFKHARIKWVDYDRMSAFPVEDAALEARLRDVCARFFVALKGASFGRCDLRVDRDGTPFMLEINPYCGVYYPPTDPGSADLCVAHDPEGHAGFTRQLIRAALRRAAKSPRRAARAPDGDAALRVFVVDAYTRRVFVRLGLLAGGEPYDDVQRFFMDALPRDAALYNDFHAQIVRLARTSAAPAPVAPNPPSRTCVRPPEGLR